MWCSNKWLFFFFFLQIVTVISSSEVFLHNGPHGPLLWEPSKFELLPSSVSPQSQNQSACQNNRHSGKKTQKKIILSWSTTWHILKNAVCFEHSKCTHIDRCSRLLSPSPANREAHTRVVIIGLEEWDKNSPFLLLFFFFFPCAPLVTLPFFPPFLFRFRERSGRKTEVKRRMERMTTKREGWERVRGRENIWWVTAEEWEDFHRSQKSIQSP